MNKLNFPVYRTTMKNNIKYEMSYDAKGLILSETEYVWNESLSYWEGRTGWKCEYDEKGNMTLEQYSGWDSVTNQWIDNEPYLIINEYDQNGNLICATKSHKDWEEIWKTEYTYLPNGKVAAEAYYVKGKESSNWVGGPDGKREFLYDEFGNNIYIISFSWWDDEYQENNMDAFIYDDSGNCITRTDYNGQPGNWNKGEWHTFKWNLDYSLEDIIYPEKTELFDELKYDFTNGAMKNLLAEWQAVNDRDSARIFFHYSNLIETEFSLTEFDPIIKLYPIPFDDKINIHSNIEFDHVYLIDLEGKTVKRYDNPSRSIDTKDIKTGGYLIRMVDISGESYTRKVNKISIF